MSDVFFFLSGLFIRSDRKRLIIKQEGGGGSVADDHGSCLCMITQITKEQEQDALWRGFT